MPTPEPMREHEARLAVEEELREIRRAMLKHQEIGRSGNFRFNVRTGVSRGSPLLFRLFGLPDDTGSVTYEQWMATIHEDDRARISEAMADIVAASSPLRFEYRAVRPDGSIFYVLAEGQPDLESPGDLEYDGVVTDITDRKAQEAMLRHAQADLAAAMQLSSLGELAGSIIHEVNQPLTAITSNAEAARRWLTSRTVNTVEAIEALDALIGQAVRAAGVVSGLKRIARGIELQLVPLNLASVIREVIELNASDLERASVWIRVHAPERLPEVLGERLQLQQVVHNLLRNAIEAMADDDRRITIHAFENEEGVHVSVADSGVGAVDSERLFDALYTTKPDGMGLGLSICRRIVAAHRGRIWATRNPDRGMTFSFSIPIATRRAGV